MYSGVAELSADGAGGNNDMQARGFPVTIEKDNEYLSASAAGQAIYAKLQGRLEATDKGSFVVIDAGSGDYEVGPSPAAARRRLAARRPGIIAYTKRIGLPETYKLVSVRRRGGNDD